MGRWTTVGDLRRRLAERWERGRFLADHASGVEWKPLSVKLKGPTAQDLVERHTEVQDWAMRLEGDSVDNRGVRRFRLETGRIGSRRLGVGYSDLPVRVWFDSLGQLAEFVGVAGDLGRYDRAHDLTSSKLPALVGWVEANPKKVVAASGVWGEMLAVVGWIRDRDVSGYYLRQMDVADVDTKFVERHRAVLDSLLAEVLPGDRIDRSVPLARFARRYGFLTKPDYVRIRTGGGADGWPGGLTEMSVPLIELDALGLAPLMVFVVENEASYLAFPLPAGSVAIFGSGFAASGLGALDWLSRQRVVYWGDIDTWGYAILDRLRDHLESVESILMDRHTLLAHRGRWGREPKPTRALLTRLTPEEAEVYDGLVDGDWGDSIRLEQELIGFGRVTEAVAALGLSER